MKLTKGERKFFKHQAIVLCVFSCITITMFYVVGEKNPITSGLLIAFAGTAFMSLPMCTLDEYQ